MNGASRRAAATLASLIALATWASPAAAAHQAKTKITRVSVKSNGKPVFADSSDPRISANGRFVAWDTDGAFSNGDVNGDLDVYRRDLKTGKVPTGEPPQRRLATDLERQLDPPGDLGRRQVARLPPLRDLQRDQRQPQLR